MADEAKTLDFAWLPAGTEALADGEYDAIVLGTGLKECILSGLLATKGQKVLHIDRNDYYGGDCASLNLTNLYGKFRNGAEPLTGLGSNRDYNIDLIPKFIMACGKLVKMLLHTKVTRYLDFKNVDGSYVYKGGKIYKVPATGEEALKSSLMGIFEKRRFRSMLMYIYNYEEDDPSTFDGLDLKTQPMSDLYAKFGVDANTQSFTGHTMALMRDDEYLRQPAIEAVRAIKMYAYSLERYGKSPYLYPIYGLGGLPEGFSRLCAIHGGTFMLHRSVDEVLIEDGKAWGIRCGNEVAKGKIIIGDPSYFPAEKTRTTGQVVRSIFILRHPINNTANSESCQIIIPAAQANRHSDIYVCVVSFAHCVAAKDTYIAIVSTTVETSNPLAELELGISLLGEYVDRFDSVSDQLEPIGDGKADNCFISASYDATSHFETTSDDVLSLYKRITGEELDMNINADSTDADQ
ncbi:acetyltransferase [Saprolegnia diclina VS20]|uniref:Rab GDP dissociation inhibitor n=1 Tax=Saprolegnia diclina (strain VS20) TaxID=1156394 RepID=T0Q659_SAPDV|nr:acetyltransferase [Saprolegnia diclina VS20]EQC28930.1 acetyltransferase [Saprolegnia diclina VS20]|eukprot:XP_008617569.1 acetyltransferase [Saprolegnia diclina VS20]